MRKIRFSHQKVQAGIVAGVLSGLLVVSAFGQGVRGVPATVFGDGNPYNGVEDSREPVMGGQGSAAFRPSAGTLKCDGIVRGTAMVVDTRDFAPGLGGVVLATAAHVLYDLQNKTLFRRCEFHFMGLGAMAGYRARVDIENAKLGSFDPNDATSAADFGEGDWAFLHVPRPWKKYRPGDSVPARDFSFTRGAGFRHAGGSIQLVALDTASGVISLSKDCTVVESGSGDLGGGAWPGQLLDDCDSGDGASGGGIVAVLDNRQYLVGIRTGSHWSADVYPAGEYPLGPPDGSGWDPMHNTNFGRAIDAQVLAELNRFVSKLMATTAL